MLYLMIEIGAVLTAFAFGLVMAPLVIVLLLLGMVLWFALMVARGVFSAKL